MKQILTFKKEIEFESSLSEIVSISLDHEEEIEREEITGNFNIYGEYKKHSDTTEINNFNYNLPFTCILPINLIKNTIKVDINNFKYDIKDNKLIVDIDYEIKGEEEKIVEEIKKEINEIIPREETKTVDNDYITYQIHIIQENETIESILKEYEVDLDTISSINDITNIKEGDKLIIPNYVND